MKIYFNKNKCMQYVLLYVMLLFNSSTVINVFADKNPTLYMIMQMTIVLIWGILFLFHWKRKLMVYTGGMFVYLTLAVCFVRLLVGGVGISFLLENITCVAIVTIAIYVNYEQAANRFVNLVYFLEIISIVFYFFQIVKPELLQVILPEYESVMTYTIWDYVQGASVSVNYSTWGRFLFCMHEASIMRNTSIFSEPANYQIVINSGFFILLFFRQQLRYSDRQYLIRIVVALLALLTCQSTTGYVCAAIILISFMLQKQDSVLKIRWKILAVILVVILLLVIEFVVNGKESLIMSVIGTKLFDDGNLDLSASTGYWRMASITTAGLTMLRNPFGVGVENAYKIIEKTVESSTGGALMRFGASIGIIPFIVAIVWTLYPVVSRKRVNAYMKFSFILYYFMTVLAQSNVFYPGLIIITLLCLSSVFTGEVKDENSMDC